MKIENRSRKQSHKLDGIGVGRIRTFPFLPIPFTTPSLMIQWKLGCQSRKLKRKNKPMTMFDSGPYNWFFGFCFRLRQPSFHCHANQASFLGSHISRSSPGTRASTWKALNLLVQTPFKHVFKPRVGPYSEKLWPRAWQCCPRPAASGSIFKASVTVFHCTDLPAGKCILHNPYLSFERDP